MATLEQKPKGEEGGSRIDSGGRIFQDEGTASAEPSRKRCAWRAWGAAKRRTCLEQRE